VRRLSVLLTFLAACDGGSNLSPDAGLPADATPDGPTPIVQFTGCGVTDSSRFTLPAVRVGQVVSYTFPFSPSPPIRRTKASR
jgi:hypothetical protein